MGDRGQVTIRPALVEHIAAPGPDARPGSYGQ